jgi:hypothetical protein
VEDTPNLGLDMTAFAKELSDESGIQVSLYYEDAEKIDRTKEKNYTDLMSRQSKWVNRMIVKARKDGVSWVFHIDDDELAYPGSNETTTSWQKVLNEVTPSCTSVHITNYEAFSPAIPVSSWGTDPGVRYLPRACAHNFAAYANGKSVSRTVFGQHAKGPHHFNGGQECNLPESSGVILHHEALATDTDDIPPKRWIEKNKLRENDNLDEIPFEASHEAIKAIKSGNKTLMKETWLKHRSVTGERFKSCPTPKKFDLSTHKYQNTVALTTMEQIRSEFLNNRK